MSGASQHVERYFNRLDSALTRVDPAERIKWLRVQRDHWEELYSEFCRSVDLGISPRIVCAEDYVLTIAGLDKRLAEAQR